MEISECKAIIIIMSVPLSPRTKSRRSTVSGIGSFEVSSVLITVSESVPSSRQAFVDASVWVSVSEGEECCCCCCSCPLVELRSVEGGPSWTVVGSSALASAAAPLPSLSFSTVLVVPLHETSTFIVVQARQVSQHTWQHVVCSWK